MNTGIKIDKSFWAQAVYMVALPVFFAGFCFLYDPFRIDEYFQLGGFSYGFHILMLSVIMFVTLVVTRSIFIPINRRFSPLGWSYALWCLFEVFVVSCFLALYTTLFSQGGLSYFEALSDCMKLAYLTLVFPYVFLVLLQLQRNMAEDLTLRDAPSEDGLIKFYDEHKRLKLTLGQSAILCIGAEFNYIKIYYMDAGQVKSFLLRNSMKSQEQSAASHGLVRCHRSYFVNPKYVKVLSKGKEGLIHAVLDSPGGMTIPVSKQYYDSLAALL